MSTAIRERVAEAAERSEQARAVLKAHEEMRRQIADAYDKGLKTGQRENMLASVLAGFLLGVVAMLSADFVAAKIVGFIS